MRPGSSKDSSLSAPFLHSNTNDDTADYRTQPKSKSKSKWESGITLSVLMNVLRFLTGSSNVSELLALRLVSQMFYEAVSSREIMFPIVGSKLIMLSSQLVHLVMPRASMFELDAEPVFAARGLPINIQDHLGVQRVLSLPSWNDIKDHFAQYEQSQSEVLRRAAYQKLSNENSTLFTVSMSAYDNGLASDNGLKDVFQVSEGFIKTLQTPLCHAVACALGCALMVIVDILWLIFFGPSETNMGLVFLGMLIYPCFAHCLCDPIPLGDHPPAIYYHLQKAYREGEQLKKYLYDPSRSITAAPRVGFFTAPAVAASSGTVIAMPSDQADGLVNQVAGGAARSV